MPSILKSPIPGHDITFKEFVPGGNLGNFDERWKWIDNSMLPAWKKLGNDDAGKVRNVMEDFLKGLFKKE
jgi:hypothetical protein